MKTLSGRAASQEAWELERLIALLRREGVTRWLEIGARDGDTFHAVMTALPPGSSGVAVDLPGGAWGRPGTELALARSVRAVIGSGRRAAMVLGDSTALETVKRVADLGPFDAVLIDGDHRYDGVKQDWENYGRLARIVAFHDIAGDGVVKPGIGPVEAPRLWREVAPFFASTEFVAPGSRMGIGVLWV